MRKEGPASRHSGGTTPQTEACLCTKEKREREEEGGRIERQQMTQLGIVVFVFLVSSEDNREGGFEMLLVHFSLLSN